MSTHNQRDSYMTIHDFHNNSHVGWDNSLKPIAEVDSGQVVSFEVVDSSGGQFSKQSTLKDIESLDFNKVNPTAGPIYIKGAQPGDTLEVEFLDFKQLNWGWTAIIPGFGLLADDFKDPAMKIFDLKNRDKTEFLHGIDLFINPFPGTVGVALPDPGHFGVIPPRKNGGNMDVRHLTSGTKLYLPIWVEGALFSIGDTHAAQGDGEVCGTAIEAGMEATVRFTLHKGKTIQEPQYEIPAQSSFELEREGYYVTTGHGESLHDASMSAIRYMIEHLVKEFKMTEEEAYMLCSITVDLRISEIVNAPNKLVSAFLPKAIFK